MNEFTDYIINKYDKEDLARLAEGALSNPVDGLIYNDDLIVLYERYNVGVWALVDELCSDCGESAANLLGYEENNDRDRKSRLVLCAVELIASQEIN